jgi:hypothetical protein
MEKSRGQKSRATVPLKQIFYYFWFSNGIFPVKVCTFSTKNSIFVG